MNEKDLKRLRDLGLTRRTGDGREAVRVTLQCRECLDGDLEQRRAALQPWCTDAARLLSRHGGEAVPDSLSVLGQTMEAYVPVDALPALESELSSRDIRLDVVMPRQILR